MTIQTDLEPKQCNLVRIYLEFDNGALVRSYAEIDIYNADNQFLLRHTVEIPWTGSEQSTIEDNISSKYALFISANGFTEYVEPEDT